MPIAVPIAMAAAEYGATTGFGLAAIGGAEAAAGMGTAAYGSFAAADALADAGMVSSMSGLQLAGLAASTVSGIGQSLQGRAAAQSATYNAAIAHNNQIVAENNATAAIQEGEANAGASSQGTKAKIGGILANQGASGVDIGSGSSIDTRASAAQTGELNSINIRADAARRAYGYKSDAYNAQVQEQMDKNEAKNAGLSSEVASAGTLLSNAANPNNSYGAYLASQSL